MEAERLLLTVQAFARQGAAVVLVTHKMADVKRYADRVTVMRGGRTVQTLDPQKVSVEQLVQLTVGESVPVAEHQPATPGEVRLQVKDLRSVGSSTLNGVNLSLHAGQIFGIAGVGGNGQAELANALMGLPQATEGEIHMAGFGDLRGASADQRRQLRIASIPADRYGAALAGSLSVAENFAIGNIHSGQYGSFWRLGYKRLKQDAQRAVADFDVQGVRSLDQKLRCCRRQCPEAGDRPRIQPRPATGAGAQPESGPGCTCHTGGACPFAGGAGRGAAVLVISEDLDEVLALADRVGVMNGGALSPSSRTPPTGKPLAKRW